MIHHQMKMRINHRMKQMDGQVFIKMQEETQWIICPKCGEKTKVKLQKSTIMKNFLLYCHKCKKEFTVDVQNFIVTVIEKDK